MASAEHDLKPGPCASRPNRLVAALLAAIPVATAALLGQIATFPNLEPWYAGLAKPSFTPPNRLFGPVWTALYVLMAIAAWRLLRLPAATPGRRLALGLFFAQLALNAAWPWMFFAAHSPLLGLLNIVPQWLLIVATAALFLRVDKASGWCLVPLALWVAYAGVLNAAVWWLNG